MSSLQKILFAYTNNTLDVSTSHRDCLGVGVTQKDVISGTAEILKDKLCSYISLQNGGADEGGEEADGLADGVDDAHDGSGVVGGEVGGGHHAAGDAGKQFNRKAYGLSFGSKNGLSFNFYYETSLNCPFLNIFLSVGESGAKTRTGFSSPNTSETFFY